MDIPAPEQTGQPEQPPCPQIADTGGIGLLPFPRVFVPRGSPFRVVSNSHLYISSSANQNVRKKFKLFTDRLLELGVRTNVSSSTNLAPLQAVYTDSGQFPKWVKMEAAMRGDTARVGGYKISVNQDGIVLQGADETGVHNACSTLQQLIEDGPDIKGMEIDDYPILPNRAIHLDCKGWPPGIDWLKRAIQILASIKINILVLEYDAHFNYAASPELALETGLTAALILELDNFARDHGVTLVPLLSCVGHASHVLSHEQFAPLREHPAYPHMYSVASPDAQNLLCSRMAELLAVHLGKIVHIGGDGALFLGSNPQTLKRAEELGGLDGVYLDHIGSLCRHLVAQGAQPLIWDELIRNMNDAQIKWLPQESILTFWLPQGLGPESAPEVLAHLERYKLMKRDVWGGTLLSPATGYSAFDSLDAWGEVADIGYVSGLIASVSTRDCANTGLLPPFESVWPAVFYAAERAWGGKQVIGRDLFPQRFVIRFFGIHNNLELQSRLWAALNAGITGEFQNACVYFDSVADQVPVRSDSLRFLMSWAEANALLALHRDIEALIRANFSNIQNGTADALMTGRLRWQILMLKEKAPGIIARLTQYAAPFAGIMAMHEYIESSIAYTLRRLEELEPLLEAYALPPEDLRDY